jgi:uncharacterized membrane protein (DUF373 family)
MGRIEVSEVYRMVVIEIKCRKNNVGVYVMKLKRIAYLLHFVLMIGVFCCFIISIYYLFHGSFEISPTKEQEEKVKLVTSVMALFFFVLGIGYHSYWNETKKTNSL